MTTIINKMSEEDVWKALESVKDPEIPIISVTEMGIVRQVEVSNEGVRVAMTPTFSGCPAIHVMKTDIETRLREVGFENVEVRTVLSPPWSTDWMTDEAKAKLKAFGVAPPAPGGGSVGNVTFFAPVSCPYCDSSDTSVKNTFGPTLCKSIYYCHGCEQPFESFKTL